MKKIFTFLLLLYAASSSAQYYYNDLVCTKQSNADLNKIISNKIKRITIANYDAQQQLQRDFSVTQLFDIKYAKSVTETRTTDGNNSTFTANYENDRIVKTTDVNTFDAATTLVYTYFGNGNIKSLTSSFIDTAAESSSIEKHIWTYANNKLPAQMLCIKNNQDTVTVVLVADANDNIVEEHWKRNNKTFDSYYYYYSLNNQLTDIVKFNSRLKKMMPVFVFDYDNNGNVKSMVQTQGVGSNYVIWQYSYTDKNLKQEAKCYDKDKQYLGKMAYAYY